MYYQMVFADTNEQTEDPTVSKIVITSDKQTFENDYQHYEKDNDILVVVGRLPVNPYICGMQVSDVISDASTTPAERISDMVRYVLTGEEIEELIQILSKQIKTDPERRS